MTLFPSSGLYPSTVLYPGTLPDDLGDGFAARLFEQLEPLQQLDTLGHLWVFCDAFGAMFQPVEDLTSMRDDGLPGYADLLDIQRIPIANIGYLGQFIGMSTKPGLDESAQRAWIQDANNFERGRPSAIIAAAQRTLTGSRTVYLLERDGSAWKYRVVTRTSETPNPAAVLADLLGQKPGPNIMVYSNIEGADYDYIAATYASYSVIGSTFAQYQDITDLVV